jgi:succinylglutamate desuccinylase
MASVEEQKEWKSFRQAISTSECGEISKNSKHEELLQSDQIYKRFDDFRQMRRRAVHNYEDLKRGEAINAIMDIIYFVKHLEKNKSDIADYLETIY